jgi:hypothetical protein
VVDRPWYVVGTSQCPQCGVEVPGARLLGRAHECDPFDRSMHEAAQLGKQLEVLLFEIKEFLRSAEGKKELAFARWYREHQQ